MDYASADVVCRQLGFPGVVDVYKSARYGQGTGPIWLDVVDCSGYESSLLFCAHRRMGDHNCGHSEDVSVQCRGNGGENN